MRSLREYFTACGRHMDSPLTVGDLVALEEFGEQQRQANEAAAIAQLELAPEPTPEELAGTSPAQLATDEQRAARAASFVADDSQADGSTGPRHMQEDTERPPLALV